jgi:hypothetical protein
VQERDHIGLLTFTLRKDAPKNTLVWPNFLDGKDFVLGSAELPGTVQTKQFNFIDWTTARLDVTTLADGAPVKSSVYFSRSFPAVLYDSQASAWSWTPGDLHADELGYLDADGKFQVVKAGSRPGPLGAPWVLLWPDPAPGIEVEPLLVRFQKRPIGLTLGKRLTALFDGPCGCVGVMPLYGTRRVSEASWVDKAVQDASFWSRAMAAFPVGIDETYRIDDKRQAVRINDHVKFRTIRDDWGTQPLELTPVSPVTGIALKANYQVKVLGTPMLTSNVATLLGPWVYASGDTFSYEIPIPSSRDNALTPVRVQGDPARQQAADALDALVRTQTIRPDDTSDGGLNLQLKEYSQAYPLLRSSTQQQIAGKLSEALAASFAPANLQTVTDPVTGLSYLMCNKIWCAGEAYDREWYAGRQLDAAYEFSCWVDPSAVSHRWKALQGLYAYFRIYNDWAWSGTLSSLYAYALCGDGMNFAYEGMLATARLARRCGDHELYEDATYRAAKQALCTYASWFMSDWEKSIDYVTWTDTSYDYAAKKGRYEIHRMPPADVQTGFGLDIYSDTTGIKVFRNGSFWHASAAIYWNNMSLDRLYLEDLYTRLFEWEYKTLPSLHPKWTDRSAIEHFTNQPYGSNMVNAHVAARDVLFGEAPSSLTRLLTNQQPGIAPLYRVRSAVDLEESGIPQLWLPTDQVQVESASWNASTRVLACKMQANDSGSVSLDWRWPGTTAPSPTPDPGPKPTSATLNGRQLAFQKIPGGFW